MKMANTFVYGTLMFPEVLNALIGRTPRSEKAVLRGYKRYSIRGQVFPGMISCEPQSQVEGLVLFDLSKREMDYFDAFEADEYYLQPVQPVLASSGEPVEAAAYIWQDALRPSLYGEWLPEAFRNAHLDSYVRMVGQFSAKLDRRSADR